VTIDAVLSGATKWTFVEGDNLAIMRAMPAAAVHLAYLDSPFNTGRAFALSDGRFAYSDKWPSLEAFVASVIERCAAARDLLTDDGCLILHVDPETSHYLKVALDGLFGRDCYRNEIVWRYRKWPSGIPDFQRCHDTLLRYTRSPEKQRWNQLYEPLAPSTLAATGTKKQQHRRVKNGGTWARNMGTLGEESPGASMSDVWEIPIVPPSGTERLGWPTQKPRALLDRIVLSCSQPGDVVLEPYCGTAPAVSSAVAHERRGVGIDSSPIAVEMATARLRAETTQLRIPFLSVTP
jgi:site-specific DNA-methyltransferase (adenine-specific)